MGNKISNLPEGFEDILMQEVASLKSTSTKSRTAAPFDDEEVHELVMGMLDGKLSSKAKKKLARSKSDPSGPRLSTSTKNSKLSRCNTDTNLDRKTSKLSRSTTQVNLDRKNSSNLSRSSTQVNFSKKNLQETREESRRRASSRRRMLDSSHSSRGKMLDASYSSRGSTKSVSPKDLDPQMVIRLLEQYSSADSKAADAYFRSVKRAPLVRVESKRAMAA